MLPIPDNGTQHSPQRPWTTELAQQRELWGDTYPGNLISLRAIGANRQAGRVKPPAARVMKKGLVERGVISSFDDMNQFTDE